MSLPHPTSKGGQPNRAGWDPKWRGHPSKVEGAQIGRDQVSKGQWRWTPAHRKKPVGRAGLMEACLSACRACRRCEQTCRVAIAGKPVDGRWLLSPPNSWHAVYPPRCCVVCHSVRQSVFSLLIYYPLHALQVHYFIALLLSLSLYLPDSLPCFLEPSFAAAAPALR